jgi:rhodanese-related sulfurtransferase
VKTAPDDPATPGGRSARAGLWLEALSVLAAGVLLAFGANLVSPRGLILTRNYFPGDGHRSSLTATNLAGTNLLALSPAQLLAWRLREQGLQLLDGPQTRQLYRDPRLPRGLLLFIDARDEELYRAGHIPGAWEFDPYRPEKYFPAVYPLCQAAEQIVIYCQGGDCDDSESAALTLRDVGIATNKLFIYMGGLTEWATNGLPVEVGERNSGTLLQTNKSK